MGLLDKIISGGVKDVIDSVASAADKFINTSDEKAQLQKELLQIQISHEEKLAEQANAELESQLKDIQDSRNMNTNIQNSEKASWLSKNFPYLLASIFCILFGIMLTMVFKTEIAEKNKEIFYTGFGILGTIVTQIVQFYFGSSIGNKRNNEFISRMAEKNGTNRNI